MRLILSTIATLLIATMPSSLYCTGSEQEPVKEGYLWEISGNGLTESSYLFGTFHGTFDILYDYVDSIPGYHAAFDKARLVCGEIDPNNPESMGNPAVMQKWMEPLPADSTYRELLSPEDYRYLDSTLIAIVKELGGNLDRMMETRPTKMYLLIHQMWQYMELKRKGIDPKQSPPKVMDTEIMKVARERSKATAGLDTEETLKMTSSLLFSSGKSLSEDAEWLIRGLNQQGMTNRSHVSIVAAYRSGELKEMERYGVMLDSLMTTILSAKEMEEYNSTQDYLMRGRNEVWMESIPEMIAVQPTFIAVGARHLPTETGLIELLRRKGYTVKAVN